MLKQLTVRTQSRRELVDLTSQIQQLVQASGITDGMCLVSSPHTSAGVTVNENADSDVVTDLLQAFSDLIGDERRFAHAEGNSGAHALTSLVGPSVTLPIDAGRLVLGRWQAIYLCEFDGPRERSLHVQMLGHRM